MTEAALQSDTPHAPAWPGWVGIAFLLFTLWRATINDFWDGWCTTVAIAGAVGLAVWVGGHRVQLRRSARSRGARYGGQTAISALFLVAALGLVNFLAARHNASFDLTESGTFTLAPQTQQAVKALKPNVRLLAFFPFGRRGQASDLLRRYSELSNHLHYELIDPDQDPDTAQKYGIKAYGTVVLDVECAPGGKAGQPIKVEADPSGTGGLALSEEKLTNALLKVARSGPKTVYFLVGHGEGDIASGQLNGYSRVRASLEDQGFVVKPLFLARSPQVPADCGALIIAGPASEPLPDEMKAIQTYLEQGGTAFVLVDPAPASGLDAFLGRWGVRVGRDLVVDASGAGRAYGAGPAMPLVKDYSPQHPITRDFRLMTFFPLARSVSPKEGPEGAAAMPIAQTGPQSFAEPYAGTNKRGRFDPAHDKRGPISLALAVSRPAGIGKEARLVVAGSSNFVSNSFFDKAGNGDLFLNAVNWLAEEEALIAIRPRPRQDHRVQLTEQQAREIFWLTVVGLPVAPLIAGIFVYWRRR